MNAVKNILAVACLIVTGTFAARADCNSAISQYNSAISDIESYLRRYSRCVSSSQGQDDCSSEFRRLPDLQGRFLSGGPALPVVLFMRGAAIGPEEHVCGSIYKMESRFKFLLLVATVQIRLGGCAI
jgi:hypothetical protein